MEQGYSGLFQQRQKMHNDFAVMDFHARFMLFFTLKIRMVCKIKPEMLPR